MNQASKTTEKASEPARDDKPWGFKVPAEFLDMYHKLPLAQKREIIQELRNSFTVLVKFNRGRQLLEAGSNEPKKLTNSLTV